MNTYTLSQINIYPVKSLGGISLSSAKVESRGLAYDRRWLLINAENQFITQREHPKLSLIRVDLQEEHLIFSYAHYPNEVLKISTQEHDNKLLNVRIWNDVCKANLLRKEVSEWFGEILGTDCRLVKMAEDDNRLVDKDYAFRQEVVSFADAYPFLIIGQSSLDDLNTRLDNPVEMRRFRPNFVFEGGLPYEEDTWKKFTIGNVAFAGVKPCARCVLTTVNPEKGEIDSKEPLRTLSLYRKVGNKILFGQNLLPIDFGIVHVGDLIALQEINTTV
ncbi:MAG: MOSC domain-containing protein [Thermoflexibacter sp.]|jgi:hypothetical protein|nr:MOSC domain-containing protein [Thermoflexibacter sp.]